jgi:TetR/AcrR family transcriptional regulator, fatty acid metabolism regulator protein
MRTRSGNKEQSILDAAVQVFAREGYYKAKIQTIAEEAGVATGSVYLYFHNKETILHRLFDNLWQELTRQFRAIVKQPGLNPIEKLDGMIDVLFDMFSHNPSLAIVFVNEQQQFTRTEREDVFTMYYEQFMDLGEEVVHEGMHAGIFNENIDIRVFRYFIFGGIRRLIHQWAQDPKNFQLNTIRQGIKYLVKQGILLR